ncbi:hypothetical protein CPB86DRAFT_776477 [Serendipita vermifera]|nr:hypothetical protein CPB86DRAFT_776477 [Serendipita vermifera]
MSTTSSASSGNIIRCKMCRYIIYSCSANMMAHNEALTEVQQDNNPEPTEGEDSSTPFNIPRTQPLISAKCSGYFVQPLQWMKFLEQGGTSGKIICPNERCKAKVGNYDWAGVSCSCGEWVTPGFCIHRSKVDELR